MRSVRSLTLLGLALAGSPAAAAEPPLVPIISTFHHWHHHWFVTLPGDPVYETVEVASRDRGPGVLPLIWVWFTERAEPKRQSHYLNDARVAPAGGGQVRDISFTMTGPEGAPVAWQPRSSTHRGGGSRSSSTGLPTSSS